jgi:hypothetical protein
MCFMKPALDQQPIIRSVGERSLPPLGVPPGPEARAAWNAMAAYRTRVPKGVYRYRSHAEMQRDSDEWNARGLMERERQRD